MARLILKALLVLMTMGGCAAFRPSSESDAPEQAVDRPAWTVIEGPWTAQYIAVLPFEDESHYNGSWDIQRGTAALLGEILSENTFYTIVSQDSVQAVLERRSKKERRGDIASIGRDLGADVVITGKVEDFNITRFMAGAQMLGGYRSYASTAKLAATLWRVVDGRELGIVGGEEEVRDRGLGLTLLGRPSEKDSQFYGLDRIEFGSEEFRKTIIGQATIEALRQIKSKIEEVITPPSALKEPTRRVVVLEVQGNEVYVSAGAEDGVKVGDKFNVYDEGKELKDPFTGEVLGHTDEQKVGAIQIVEIKAAHLSKARIVDGRVEANSTVRAE